MVIKKREFLISTDPDLARIQARYVAVAKSVVKTPGKKEVCRKILVEIVRRFPRLKKEFLNDL